MDDNINNINRVAVMRPFFGKGETPKKFKKKTKKANLPEEPGGDNLEDDLQANNPDNENNKTRGRILDVKI